nr:Rne/Rng family ribonuclease [Salsipaludibacter albus]
MLVSADGTRTQIAVLEERNLVEHHVTNVEDRTLVGNIYMARVQNVLPGMEAAFLDIGTGRNGVLYAGEVLYDDLDVEEGSTPRIEDALKPGQKVLVQVTKDAMGTKGPRLTMQLSLAGRYTVLAPKSDVFGISRKLTDKERDRLRTAVKKVKPAEHGVIVRTAAEDAPEELLEADLGRLLRVWAGIEEKAASAAALTPVYEEPPLHVKLIRDSFGAEYEQAIIDDAEIHDAVVEYLSEVTSDEADKVQLYGMARWEREHPEAAEAADSDEDRPRFAPLFDAYNVTEQLRKALSRKVWLPSGGYLIIEVTEAMKVIDVNTGKYTGGKRSNLEEVVFKTNLEAAEEIVRQLRLRDMGGIIIIDFIDMLKKANQDQVVATLKRELLRDRTKTRVSDVSRLGLVQMTRKNVSHGLLESFGHRCETCDGTGWTTEFD